MGVGGQRHAPAALPPGNTRYPLYTGWVAPGPVWTGAENLALTGIRSPDRPARSDQFLYTFFQGTYTISNVTSGYNFLLTVSNAQISVCSTTVQGYS